MSVLLLSLGSEIFRRSAQRSRQAVRRTPKFRIFPGVDGLKLPPESTFRSTLCAELELAEATGPRPIRSIARYLGCLLSWGRAQGRASPPETLRDPSRRIEDNTTAC